MSLAPRGLGHAIHFEFHTPTLRAGRTPHGERALVFEDHPRIPPPEDPAALPPGADPLAAGGVSPPAATLTPRETPEPATEAPRRFIDNQTEVGFRAGLLRSARDNYDLFVAPEDRADVLSRLGPVERTQVADGGPDLPAIRMTPDVRSRVNAGDVPFGEATPTRRLAFAAADGEGPPDGAYRTNGEGYILWLPFKDRWGDPRFNPEDREHALGALREITERGPAFWRTAPWDQVLRAKDDVNEVLAQLFFYKPDTPETVRRMGANPIYQRHAEGATPEEAQASAERWFHNGELWAYLNHRAHGNGFGLEEGSAAPVMATAEGARAARLKPVPEDLVDFGTAAREAIHTLEASRRAGIKALLHHDTRVDPTAPKPPKPPKPVKPAPATLPLDKAGRYSAVRRTIEGLGDEWFKNEEGKGGRPGYQLLNAIRKGRNVTAAEIRDMNLDVLAKLERPTSRDLLLHWVDARTLQMRQDVKKFDPARPTRNYDYGNTRAFDGPRVPGYGRYFERTYAWPEQIGKAGADVPMADRQNSHWGRGVWGSNRGSFRDVPKFGKGTLIEELQRDFHQAVTSGRRREVSVEEYRRMQARAPMIRQAENTIRSRLQSISDAAPNEDARGQLMATAWDDAARRADPDAWAEKVRAAVEGIPHWQQDMREIALRSIEVIRSETARVPELRDEKLLQDHMDAYEGNNQLRGVQPEQPLDDSQSIRFMVRDAFIANAKEGGAWVAIPTGALNDRIQYNSYASAAHFYDGALRNVLGKVARDIDPSLKVERVILPTPPLKRGVPVYMVKGIKPEVNERLKSEGLPRYAIGNAARREDGGPMHAAAWRDHIEAHLREDPVWGKPAVRLMDHGRLQLIPSPDHLPPDVLRYVEESGETIPAWAGALLDRRTGKAYFFTDALEPSNLRGLLIHEVGAHEGLPNMLGKRRHTALLEYVAKRIAEEERSWPALAEKKGLDVENDRQLIPWLWAVDQVRGHHSTIFRREGQEEHAFNGDELDEIVAHVAERMQQIGDQHPAASTEKWEADRTWWENLQGAVKRWAVTALGKGELSARDIHILVRGALQREARLADTHEPLVAVDASRVLMFAKREGFEGEDPHAAMQWLDDQGYFSPAVSAVARYPQAKASREQMVGWLQNQPGVKKDELATLYLDEFMRGGKTATREEFQQWVNANRYATDIEWRSHEGNAEGQEEVPQWGNNYTYLQPRAKAPGESPHEHSPPGYFEAIIRPRTEDMPGGRWTGGHMRGGIAHVRGAVDTEVGGKLSGHIVEIQSDMFDAPPEAFRADVRVAHREAKERADAELARVLPLVQADDPGAHVGEGGFIVPSWGDDDVRGAPLGAWSPDPKIQAVAEMIRRYNVMRERASTDVVVRPGDRGLADVKYAEGVLDTRAPFAKTWPEKAFTDVVRDLIRNGQERISWSTTDAVRAINGMAGYAGTLYDARIPKLARDWLGAEVKQGEIAEAKRAIMGEDEVMAAGHDITDLALSEALQRLKLDTHDHSWDELITNATQEVFLDSSLYEAMLHHDMGALPKAGKLREDAENAFHDAFADDPHADDPSPEQLAQLGSIWATNVMFKVQEFIHQQLSAPKGPLMAHYFDVTPEVRERALGPRAFFFGIGSSDGAAAAPPAPRRVPANADVNERLNALLDGFHDAQGNPVFGTPEGQQLRSQLQALLDEQPKKKTGRDYRTTTRGGRSKAKLPEANAAAATLAAGAAAVSATGVVTAVVANEQERAQRLEEYQAMQRQAAADRVKYEAAAERRAELERINAAVAAHDLQSLPDMPTDGGKQERIAWLQQATGWAQTWSGVDAEFLQALIARETAYTLDPTIRPVTASGKVLSAAAGLGQFIPDTWAHEVRRVGATYHIEGADRPVGTLAHDPAIQELRYDPRLAVAMVAEHAAENIRYMEGHLNRPITSAEAYAGHLFGKDGAIRFIAGVEQGWSAARMKREFPAAVAANPFMQHHTATEIMDGLMMEFGNNTPLMPSAPDNTTPDPEE